MGHRHHVDPAELEPLADYRRRVLSGLSPLTPIQTALSEAHGSVLAEDAIKAAIKDYKTKQGATDDAPAAAAQ